MSQGPTTGSAGAAPPTTSVYRSPLFLGVAALAGIAALLDWLGVGFFARRGSVLLMVVPAALLFTLVRDGLRTGRIVARGNGYVERSQDTRTFWFLVGVYTLVGLLLCCGLAALLLGGLR